MCNLYSVTTNQEAMRRIFRFDVDLTGNLPSISGVFPDTMAPIGYYVVKAGSTADATTGWIFGTSNNTGVTGVRIKNVQTSATEDVAVKGCFIAIGHSPNTDIFKGQLEMQDGYIVTRSGLSGMATMTSEIGRAHV